MIKLIIRIVLKYKVQIRIREIESFHLHYEQYITLPLPFLYICPFLFCVGIMKFSKRFH